MEQAVRLAEQIGAEAYGHASTQVNFPTDHPQYLGKIAETNVRTKQMCQKLNKADVILAVGCPLFSDYFYVPKTMIPAETRFIHIDINAAEIGKGGTADVGIHTVPASALTLLSTELDACMTEKERQAAAMWAEEANSNSITRQVTTAQCLSVK